MAIRERRIQEKEKVKCERRAHAPLQLLLHKIRPHASVSCFCSSIPMGVFCPINKKKRVCFLLWRIFLLSTLTRLILFVCMREQHRTSKNVEKGCIKASYSGRFIRMSCTFIRASYQLQNCTFCMKRRGKRRT
jgi:hypothetical protein